MTTFYLAEAGSDTANGRTPETAWKSVDRLNAAIKSMEFGPGDNARFKRGDHFYGVPEIPGTVDGTRGWMTFGPYGEGERPKLDLYKYPNVWEQVGSTSIWRARIDELGDYEGRTSDKTDVGFIKVDGTIHGAKKASTGALTQMWDFFSGTYEAPGADGYVYVYSGANPSTLAEEIAVAPWGVWTEEFGAPELTPMMNTAFRGLDVFGSGGTGVAGSAYWAPDNVHVEGCRIREHGGSYIAGFSAGTRQGNGVTPLLGSNDWYVYDNEIADIYDVALSLQGDQAWPQGHSASARIHMDRNRIYRCSQTIEFWTGGTTGMGVSDSTANDNIAFYAGYNWSYPVRNNQTGRGCHILLYQNDLPIGVEIARNVFFGARTNYITATEGYNEALNIHDNVVFLEPNTPLEFLGDDPSVYTVEDGAAWSAVRGQDKGTVFFSLPSTPATMVEALPLLRSAIGSLNRQLAMLIRNTQDRVGDFAQRIYLLESAPIDPVEAGIVLTAVGDDNPDDVPDGTLILDKPVQTQVWVEPFTGANGASWPGSWTTEFANWSGLDGLIDIQSNQGRMRPHNDAWQSAWAHRAGPVTNGQVRGKVTIPDGGARYAEVKMRSQGLGFDGSTLRNVGLSISVQDKCRLLVTPGGPGSNDFFDDELIGIAPQANKQYSFILQVVGTRMSAKVWETGTTEPLTWQQSVTIPEGFLGTGVNLTASNGPAGSRAVVLWDGIELIDMEDNLTVRGVMLDGSILPVAFGGGGEPGEDGESVVVYEVNDSDWPPPADSNPLHFYVRVPD